MREAISSRISQIAIIDSLYTAVALKNLIQWLTILKIYQIFSTVFGYRGCIFSSNKLNALFTGCRLEIRY